MSEYKSDVQVAAEITDPKSAFNALQPMAGRGVPSSLRGGQSGSTDYGLLGELILMVVAKHGEGWKKDVAAKGLSGLRLSDKQLWVAAFEFVKIAPTVENMTALMAD